MSKLSLEQLKKQAKELVRGHAKADSQALAFIRAHHPKWVHASDDEVAAGAFQLSDAQWAIARSVGHASWPELVHHLASIPLVALRDLVVFPNQRAVIQVGRSRSSVAIEAALRGDGLVAFVAQRAAALECPMAADLFAVGTLAKVISSKPTDRNLSVVQVEGLRRVRIERVDERDGMLVAETSTIDPEEPPTIADPESARRAALVAIEAIARHLPELPPAAVTRAMLLPHLHVLPAAVQQEILETDDPARWAQALASALAL